MSSFCRLLIAFRIKPSLEINSVYIRSAPLSLQTARKGGSLTSSIGASRRGKSGRETEPILIMRKDNASCNSDYLFEIQAGMASIGDFRPDYLWHNHHRLQSSGDGG